MKNRHFTHKSRILIILLIIACASLGVRALLHYRFHESALLYVGIPFLIAMVLVMVRSPAENVSWQRHYLNHLIDAFIIMFASSIVLFEGFLCVAMFMPIYLIAMLLVFTIDYLSRRARKNNRSTLGIHFIPLLMAFSAFEGVDPQMSFDRHEQVSATRLVNASVAEIKHNLQLPMDLQKTRPWFLHLFPMPYAIQAGSLSPGDIHEIHFRYYRWFVTNMHEGTMRLEITAVTENRIKTTFVGDTSYISHYMHLKGTEILLQAIDAQHTQVTLNIEFERSLDPYWYFSPVERYGVGKTAEYLLAEVIAHENI